jgi:hypothetical protein
MCLARPRKHRDTCWNPCELLMDTFEAFASSTAGVPLEAVPEGTTLSPTAERKGMYT